MNLGRIGTGAFLAIIVSAMPAWAQGGADCSDCSTVPDTTLPAGLFYCQRGEAECNLIEVGVPKISREVIYLTTPVEVQVACTPHTTVTIGGTYRHSINTNWETIGTVGYESGKAIALIAGKIKAELSHGRGGGLTDQTFIDVSTTLTFICKEGKVTGAVNFYKVDATLAIASEYFAFVEICASADCVTDCSGSPSYFTTTCKSGSIKFERATAIKLEHIVLDVAPGDCCESGDLDQEKNPREENAQTEVKPVKVTAVPEGLPEPSVGTPDSPQRKP